MYRRATERLLTFHSLFTGLSGLTIAYELTRAGHQVIVYEASERAGGRLFTYERENTIIELGGMRLPLDVHYLIDTYIRKRFRLPLEPFISSDPKSFVYINGIHSQLDNTTFFPGQFHLNVYANETNQVCSSNRIRFEEENLFL